MKKIALFLLTLVAFAFGSCSVDDGRKASLEVLPVESYELPQMFTYGQTYDIKITFKKPTDCYAFEGFYYDKQGSSRTIGVAAVVYDRNDCEVDETLYTESFQFTCSYHDPYTFKFYKGEDASGNSIFEEVKIPVGY